MLSLRVLRNLLRVVLVVRQPVMPFGDADLRIGAEVQLATEHERDDARDVGAERQPLQLVHQLDVLVEALGNTGRTFERRQLGVVAALRRAECAARPRAPSRDIPSTVVRSRLPSEPLQPSQDPSVTESRMLWLLPRLRGALLRECRRRRTAARTRCADCSRSAAASSASVHASVFR